MRSGEPALLRQVHCGRVAAAVPVVVVEDEPDRSIVFWRAGTPIRRIEPGGLFAWLRGEDDARATTWQRTNVLQIAAAGRAHATWAMWSSETSEFLGWYVNLQEPMRRTSRGWDTFDHVLDIVVTPDLEWSWKDVESFEWAVEEGMFSPAEADAIWREGQVVCEDIDERRPPFGEPWPSWRPDASWPEMALPADWAGS